MTLDTYSASWTILDFTSCTFVSELLPRVRRPSCDRLHGTRCNAGKLATRSCNCQAPHFGISRSLRVSVVIRIVTHDYESFASICVGSRRGLELAIDVQVLLSARVLLTICPRTFLLKFVESMLTVLRLTRHPVQGVGSPTVLSTEPGRGPDLHCP